MSTVAQPSTALTEDKKRQCWDLATYITARLKGQPATPPVWFTAEQATELDAILNDPAECAGILNWAVQGAVRYHALPPTDRAALQADAHRYSNLKGV